MLRRRERYNGLRERLKQVDEQLEQQRAELVTTHGLLDESTKLRQAIQQEESAKVRGAIEAELAAERKKLEDTRSQMKESVIEEVQGLLDKHQTTEAHLRARIQELEDQLEQSRVEQDELENKLADTEVQLETIQEQFEASQKRCEALEASLNSNKADEKAHKVMAALMKAFEMEREGMQHRYTDLHQLFQQSVRDLMYMTEEVRYLSCVCFP